MNNNPQESPEKLSISEQRDALLKINPDLLFGVYNLDDSTGEIYNLSLAEDCLTCWPNQVDNLEGLDENTDIAILDLGELRKGKIEVFNGEKDVYITNPILLSNGVLDYVEAYSSPSKNFHKRTYYFDLI